MLIVIDACFTNSSRFWSFPFTFQIKEHKLHPKRISVPKVTTVLGIVKVFKLVQPLKSRFPILVTPSGIMIEERLIQPLKHSEPRLTTPLGMSIEVRLIQSSSASDPIAVIVVCKRTLVEYVFRLDIVSFYRKLHISHIDITLTSRYNFYPR